MTILPWVRRQERQAPSPSKTARHRGIWSFVLLAEEIQIVDETVERLM
jgi:hypothetical protein